jgi:TPR repeat protein
MARLMLSAVTGVDCRRETARYFKMAADQDNLFDQSCYGSCLEKGEGVAKNVAEAARYYKMAADQREEDANSIFAWQFWHSTPVGANGRAWKHCFKKRIPFNVHVPYFSPGRIRLPCPVL